MPAYTYDTLPGKARSYWIATGPQVSFPQMEDGITVDVAIVGAGITGITAGYLLKQAGYKVALIDADKVMHGTTGQTTAKVTVQHSLIYDYLLKTFGEDKARTYAMANLAGLGMIAELAGANDIDCDFKRVPSFVFTRQEHMVPKLEKEAEAMRKIGLKATLSTDLPGEFGAVAAIRLEEQARFHPLKYLAPLVQAIPGDGSHVFERTMAYSIDDGKPCKVRTGKGILKAGKVLVCTNFPFYDPVFYFARCYQERSYAMARTASSAACDALVYEVDKPMFGYRWHDGPGPVGIVSGEDNKTGQGGSTLKHYAGLGTWAEKILGQKNVDYHWSTQDTYTLDQVPLIGRLKPGSKNILLATGYKGWGMTTGTMAAILLRDLALGESNKWASFFDPFTRVSLHQFKKLMVTGINVTEQYIKGYTPDLWPGSIEGMQPGEARVFKHLKDKIAVYKDEDGKVHAVSAVCTHLRCVVTWNDAERTWDCPCHGSRFNYDGVVLHGPAKGNLMQVTGARLNKGA